MELSQTSSMITALTSDCRAGNPSLNATDKSLSKDTQTLSSLPGSDMISLESRRLRPLNPKSGGPNDITAVSGERIALFLAPPLRVPQ